MIDRISHAQIRGARGMLDWSMVDLSKAAGISVSTVKRAEERDGSAVSPVALSLIGQALERAGISFLHDGEKCQGIMLKMEYGHRQKQDDNHGLMDGHGSSLHDHRPSSSLVP